KTIHRREPVRVALCGSSGSVDTRAVIPPSDGPRAGRRQGAAPSLTPRRPSPCHPETGQTDQLRATPRFLHDRRALLEPRVRLSIGAVTRSVEVDAYGNPGRFIRIMRTLVLPPTMSSVMPSGPP